MEWIMDFCSIFTIARVSMGSVKKGWKIWSLLLLEVFILLGSLPDKRQKDFYQIVVRIMVH